jgi:hypothetical protein
MWGRIRNSCEQNTYAGKHKYGQNITDPFSFAPKMK